jgi:hypothetical protein
VRVFTPAIASLAVAVAVSAAASTSTAPRVPPARDPGGYPVAVIGHGLDYTLAHIVDRLARDGEGEIVGYDFIRGNRQPYRAHLRNGAQATPKDAHLSASEIVLSDGQATTLIPLKTDPSDLATLTRAISYSAKTRARVTLFLWPISKEHIGDVMASASRRFPNQLFIVPAGSTGLNLDADPSNAKAHLPNVLVVTATDSNGLPIGRSNRGIETIDLAAAIEPVSVNGDMRSSDEQGPTELAAARIAALAARLAAVETGLSAEQMKVRILSLAAPWDSEAARLAKSGWIGAPRRHFWLE